jgi:hypothetical protein
MLAEQHALCELALIVHAGREQTGALDLSASVADHLETFNCLAEPMVGIPPSSFAEVVHGGQFQDSRKSRLLIKVFGYSKRLSGVDLGLESCWHQAAGKSERRQRASDG